MKLSHVDLVHQICCLSYLICHTEHRLGHLHNTAVETQTHAANRLRRQLLLYFTTRTTVYASTKQAANLDSDYVLVIHSVHHHPDCPVGNQPDVQVQSFVFGISVISSGYTKYISSHGLTTPGLALSVTPNAGFRLRCILLIHSALFVAPLSHPTSLLISSY